MSIKKKAEEAVGGQKITIHQRNDKNNRLFTNKLKIRGTLKQFSGKTEAEIYQKIYTTFTSKEHTPVEQVWFEYFKHICETEEKTSKTLKIYEDDWGRISTSFKKSQFVK